MRSSVARRVKLRRVQSSAIEAVAYDPRRGRLEVRWVGQQRVYRYHRVPAEVCEELVQAESKGAYVNEQIIQAHRQMIDRGHALGLRVYGGTLNPVEGYPFPGFWTPAMEAKRQAVNLWIRTSNAYDAVIDFDRLLRDPSHPSRLLPAYDSGDHVHPNDIGYRAMADSIDLSLFRDHDED